jgi:Na+/melibiose symporter-like transporter
MLNNNYISKFSLIGYAVLVFPAAFAGIPIYVNIPDFYITHYGVSLTTMAILLVILRLFDAFIDFFIGYSSDRWHYLRPYVISSASLLLIIGFFLITFPIFHPVTCFTLGVFFASIGFGAIMINLSALGGIWSQDTKEKMRISSYREVFRMLGLICACTLPSYLIIHFDILSAYQYMTVFLAVITVVFTIIFVCWYSRNKYRLHDQKETVLPSFKAYFKLDWKIYRPLYETYLFNITGNAITSVLFIFYARDYMHAEKYVGIFLLSYFLSGMLSIPLLNKLSALTNKRFVWLLTTLLSAIACFLAFFLLQGQVVAYFFLCIIAGVSFGADLTIPPALLGDLVEIKKDYSYSTGLYSIIAFLYKFSLAIASVIILPILSYVNFTPGMFNDDKELYVLVILYTLVVFLFKLLAAIRLYVWNKRLAL